MKHLSMRILKSTGLVQFLNNTCVPILLMSSGKGMTLSVLSLAMVKNSRLLTIHSKLGWQPMLKKDNSEFKILEKATGHFATIFLKIMYSLQILKKKNLSRIIVIWAKLDILIEIV